MTGLAAITARRSSAVSGPSREEGGRISVALHDGRLALGFQRRHQRLPDAQFQDHALGVELRIGPERLRRCLHRPLLARRIGAQRVLYAIAELAGNAVGNIERVLRDEIDADALGSDQPGDPLDTLKQRFRRFLEQEMRLVEEEDELGLGRIADLGSFSNSALSSQSRKLE